MTVRDTHPTVSDLLDALAARRAIPNPVLQQTHEIREYRNDLVHEESGAVRPVAPAESTRRLHQFLGWMPPDW